MEDRARGRNHLVRGERVHRDVVLVQLGGQAGREPLDRRLAHAVDGAAPPGPAGRGHDRVPGRPGRDVQDPAAPPLPHPRQHERGQVERRLHLNLEHQLIPARGEILDPGEIGHGGVVDQDVRRSELPNRLADQPLAVARPGQVGGDGDAGAARRADLRHGLADRARQRRAIRSGRPRRHCHGRASRPEPPGDLGADAAARAGHNRDLSVQHAHDQRPFGSPAPACSTRARHAAPG